MTQEISKEHGSSFFRKLFRFIFWPVRKWRNAVVTLIVLFTVNNIAVQLLQTTLKAQREVSRSTGELATLSDLQIPDLTDNENAAIVYRYAHAQFRMPEGVDFEKYEIVKRYCASKTHDSRQGLSGKEARDPLTPEEEAVVDTFVSSNDHAYEAIREARTKPMCQFGEYSNPFVVVSDTYTYSSLKSYRPLAAFIALRAVWEARHGNTNGAYEWIGHGLHFINNQQNDPLLIHGLVQSAMIEIILNALDTVMCETAWPGNLPDGVEQELIPLQDRRTYARFIEGERCYATADENRLVPGPRILDILTRLTLYKAQSDLVVAVREPDPKKRQILLAKVEQNYSPLQCDIHIGFRFDKIFAQPLVFTLLRATETFDRSEAKVMNASQAIALKRYKQTHGQYPDTLQQLISGDFKALPCDPFNGEPFHYKKEREGFLLYSVGQNRVDDGGISGSKMDGDIVWHMTQ